MTDFPSLVYASSECSLPVESTQENFGAVWPTSRITELLMMGWLLTLLMNYCFFA